MDYRILQRRLQTDAANVVDSLLMTFVGLALLSLALSSGHFVWALVSAVVTLIGFLLFVAVWRDLKRVRGLIR